MADIERSRRALRRRDREQLELDLSGPGQARRDDPDTAKEAAILLGTGETLRRDIVNVHVKAGPRGLTGDQMHEQVNALRIKRGDNKVDRDSVVPRRPELERLELLEKGEFKRPGNHGRDQEVWVATQKAKRLRL
jgi:hypothetical protein